MLGRRDLPSFSLVFPNIYSTGSCFISGATSKMGIHFNFMLFLGFTLPVLVRTFTFTVDTQPSQCDLLSISWAGGQPPFRLIVVMPNFVNFNFSIPDQNFQSDVGRGTYRIPAFPVPQQTQIFFAMSDANGPVSGGTSSIMTVGASVSSQNCDTSLPANDFVWAYNGPPSVCENLIFNYTGPIAPLTIFALIPGGSDSFVLPFSPPDAPVFHWKAAIKAQTQVAFSMIDSQGRKGVTCPLRIVAPSNDTSCLSNAFPNSTSVSGYPGPTTSVSDDGSPNSPSAQRTALSTGGIIGIAIGGASFLGILVAGLVCRRTTKNKRYSPRLIPDADIISPFSVNSSENYTPSGDARLGRGRKLPAQLDVMGEVAAPTDPPPSYRDRRSGLIDSPYRPAISLVNSQRR
ncbi:hypothetical protein L218DRAFT_241665 [Marasmius fiardii PR-910]|nr:hypothetical protein L218DRAFT_241665 [Marasmius fiardii PR-910]